MKYELGSNEDFEIKTKGGGTLKAPSVPVDATLATAEDMAAALALKAAATDLPYALVTLTPGPDLWSFSGNVQGGVTYSVSIESDDGSGYNYTLLGNGDYIDQTNKSTDAETEIEFFSAGITATRPSANAAALLDRAVNAVPVTGDTTLTLPAANPGHMRDLYVRLTVSATSAVTWTVAQGETWDAMGAPPSTFAAGTYLYRLTEVAAGVWHCEDMLALVGLEAALAAINGGVAS